MGGGWWWWWVTAAHSCCAPHACSIVAWSRILVQFKTHFPPHLLSFRWVFPRWHHRCLNGKLSHDRQQWTTESQRGLGQLLPCVRLFDFYCAPTISVVLRAGRDTKNLMSHSFVTSAPAVILFSVSQNEKPGVGRGRLSLLTPAAFMMVTVDVARHVAASEFTQLSDVLFGMIFCVPTCPNLSLQPLHWCLSSAWMCTWECVFEGQRSQSCPMTTEFLKNPWPPCWSCRATVYWATTSHHSQMLKGCERRIQLFTKERRKDELFEGEACVGHSWTASVSPLRLT